MNKVQILPTSIASKIAAGEIIERPASVIKELLENSLDAGAKNIEIHLQNAGQTLIHLKDDGHGIDEEDLQKLFNRHATSKLKTAEDLENILSFGFRGEALYSIAAISDITLKTQTKDTANGWEIHLRGGERLNLRPTSLGRTGTEIEIKELFYNTPARRKFLKSNTAEIHQILNLVIPYALLYPKVRFVLTHQDKELLNLPVAKTTTERIRQTLHFDEKHLIETKRAITENNYTIHTVIGDINIKRARRDMQFIYVNNRPVQNKNISFHLNDVCRLIMPDDAYPFFFLSIELDPKDVDVNIHPTKREVKINNETKLCQFLRNSVEEALMTQTSIPQVNLKNFIDADKAKSAIDGAFSSRTFPSSTFNEDHSQTFESNIGSQTTSVRDYAFPSSLQEEQGSFIPENRYFSEKKDSIQHKFENAHFVGSFITKYLLFQSDRSLLIVDQHAAQERIMYELLIKNMQKGTLEVQNLLSPVVLRLTPQEMLIWEEMKDTLDEIGLSNNQWDNESVAIHAHPILIKDIEKAVRQILAGETIPKTDHDTLARRACRSSIMAGDKINREQAEFQREQLLQCLDPFTCPHGRPTVIELTEDFLNKQFLRT